MNNVRSTYNFIVEVCYHYILFIYFVSLGWSNFFFRPVPRVCVGCAYVRECVSVTCIHTLYLSYLARVRMSSLLFAVYLHWIFTIPLCVHTFQPIFGVIDLSKCLLICLMFNRFFFSSQKYYFTCLLVYIANRDYFNHCFWHASWGLVAIIVNSNFTTHVRRKSNYTYFRCSNPFFMHAFLSVGIVWLLIFGFLFSYLQGLYDCSSFFHLKLSISFDILCFKLFLRFLPFG